jgi:hypothetical protein
METMHDLFGRPWFLNGVHQKRFTDETYSGSTVPEMAQGSIFEADGKGEDDIHVENVRGDNRKC